MKYMTTACNFGRKLVQGAVFAGAVTVSAASMAAPQTIDTTGAIAQLGEGSSAAAVIGVAFIAFCVLIGVLIRTRRVGS